MWLFQIIKNKNVFSIKTTTNYQENRLQILKKSTIEKMKTWLVCGEQRDANHSPAPDA